MGSLQNGEFKKCKKSLENIAVMLDCAEVCLKCLNYKEKYCLDNSQAENLDNSRDRIRKIVERIDKELCSEY